MIREKSGNSRNLSFRDQTVPIKGVNDKYEDFKSFRDKVVIIKDKIVIRISKLNETCATKKYGLKPAENSTMLIDAYIRRFFETLRHKMLSILVTKNDNMN